MATMTAQQIYEAFRNAAGTEMWQAAQQSASQLSQEMPALAADIKRLQNTMNEAWHGQAADIASQGAEPLALEYMNTAEGLGQAQDLVGRQSASFDSAARSVQPVPPEPTAVDVINAALGGPDMQQQMNSYLAASQHNVDVYRGYHGASQYNTDSLPLDYGHLTTDNASIADVAPTTSAPTNAVPAPRANQVSVRPSSHIGPSGVPSTPTHEATATSPRSSNTTGTTPPGATQPPASAPTPTNPSGGQGSTVSGTPTETEPATVPATDPSPVTDDVMPNVAVFDQLGAGSLSAKPIGRSGARQATGSDPGRDDSRRPNDPRLTDGEPDPTRTPPSVEETSVESSTPVADNTEFAPMAGTPTHRRADDEDEEHRITTYEEPDPYDLFGIPERAVLPVIGE